MTAIECSGLRKVFVSLKKQPGVAGSLRSLVSRETTEKVAVEGLTLQIPRGQFVGFLGPNGAGKTTTIKMLTGILFPSAGEAKVLGHRPFDRKHEMLRRIALVMGNKQQLWWDLPARESFSVLKELYDIDTKAYQTRLDRLITDLDLSDKVDMQVRKMSLGERMKCELVAALLHSPEVLFLDEPTIGLDVVSQQGIRSFLREYNEETQCTVLLTSHYMQDVEELCERVVVINHGRLVYDGALEDLSVRYAPTRRLRLTLQSAQSGYAFPASVTVLEAQGTELLLSIPREDTPTLTASLLRDLPVVDLALEDTDIEDVIRTLFESDQ